MRTIKMLVVICLLLVVGCQPSGRHRIKYSDYNGDTMSVIGLPDKDGYMIVEMQCIMRVPSPVDDPIWGE